MYHIFFVVVDFFALGTTKNLEFLNCNFTSFFKLALSTQALPRFEAALGHNLRLAVQKLSSVFPPAAPEADVMEMLMRRRGTSGEPSSLSFYLPSVYYAVYLYCVR